MYPDSHKELLTPKKAAQTKQENEIKQVTST